MASSCPRGRKYETDFARYLELGEEIKTGSAYRHEALQVLNRMRKLVAATV